LFSDRFLILENSLINIAGAKRLIFICSFQLFSLKFKILSLLKIEALLMMQLILPKLLFEVSIIFFIVFVFKRLA
jgi:hypothetical protein